jgi:hypothetical protein
MRIAKGLPDLERVVTRIHAKNCRTKDFVEEDGACLAIFIFFLKKSH